MDKSVENLKIYKLTYELLLFVFKDAVHFFPREFKYNLGEKIKDTLLECILEIYKANKKPIQERNTHIEDILTNLKSFEIMIQLSFDLHILPPKKYNFINSKIIQLRKMIYWRKWMIWKYL